MTTAATKRTGNVLSAFMISPVTTAKTEKTQVRILFLDAFPTMPLEDVMDNLRADMPYVEPTDAKEGIVLVLSTGEENRAVSEERLGRVQEWIVSNRRPLFVAVFDPLASPVPDGAFSKIRITVPPREESLKNHFTLDGDRVFVPIYKRKLPDQVEAVVHEYR